MRTDIIVPARLTQIARGAHVSSSFDQIDPIADSRWREFILRHPRASVFHSPEWLCALQRTYGYQPMVFALSHRGQPLQDAIPFCLVKSWLVRPRIVSLPFSDHAEPLVSNQENLLELLAFLGEGVADGRWTSVEVRPPCAMNSFTNWSNYHNGQQFVLHNLDLEPSLEKLFRRLNTDSIQRKIRRALREGLRYQEGRSDEQLRKFFRLTVITRRRKSLPPPPFNWFRNVVECLGERAKIRIATTRSGELAGAVLTLHFKDTVLFKYGASDSRFHNLGTMPFLLWQAIEEAKNSGASQFDFGRSEISNLGLIRFKDHFGTKRSELTHKVFPATSWEASAESWKMALARKVFAKLPDQALILAGRLIYPHIG